MVLRWLRAGQEARRLAQADAEALMRDHGSGSEAALRGNRTSVSGPQRAI
jgi:hypothetical protein